MNKYVSRVIAVCTALACAAAVDAQILDGEWSGRLELGMGRGLKLVLHIESADSIVTLDSPDQGAYGIEGETVYLSSDSVNMRVPNLGMSYAAALSAGKLEGTFMQGMMKLPLTLERGVKKVHRPQTPQPPLPYTTREVRIENVDAGAVLAGTLSLPQGSNASTPVVVMVTGSGLQNRDEELFEHKPFAVIADCLARNGIASLRYDDRGFGASTGDALNATTADFASDARAVMEWLRREEGFRRAGILGHSEGGLIAYMLVAGEAPPDFIVALAPPAVRGTKIIAYQNKVALLKSGVPEKEVDEFAAAMEKVMDSKLSATGSTEEADAVVARLYPQYNDNAVTRNLAASLKSMLTAEANNYWMTYFLNYDPADDMTALNNHAFIIYGEKDRQVPPSLNESPARRFAPAAKVKVYDGLNHLMQHAVTGDVEEYGQIEETISPEVLSDIVGFIKESAFE